MMEDIHIADGIAVKLLLAGIVIAGGAVGSLGIAPATSQTVADGIADGPSPALMFPIPNATIGAGSFQLSLDGKGNDPLSTRFPINNFTVTSPIGDVTAAGTPWAVKGTDRVDGTGAGSTVSRAYALAGHEDPDEIPQDMDPY